MGSIDEISASIGEMRSDIKHVRDQLDHLHSDLCPRVHTLEESHNKRAGMAMLVSGVAGAGGGSLIPPLLKLFWLKLGS